MWEGKLASMFLNTFNFQSLCLLHAGIFSVGKFKLIWHPFYVIVLSGACMAEGEIPLSAACTCWKVALLSPMTPSVPSCMSHILKEHNRFSVRLLLSCNCSVHVGWRQRMALKKMPSVWQTQVLLYTHPSDFILSACTKCFYCNRLSSHLGHYLVIFQPGAGLSFLYTSSHISHKHLYLWFTNMTFDGSHCSCCLNVMRWCSKLVQTHKMWSYILHFYAAKHINVVEKFSNIPLQKWCILYQWCKLPIPF